jgi:predicted RNase H-like HicB family nuclease
MVKQKYVYWKDDDMWLGYLEESPDYWAQGETEEELKENLIDLYKELSSELIRTLSKRENL